VIETIADLFSNAVFGITEVSQLAKLFKTKVLAERGGFEPPIQLLTV